MFIIYFINPLTCIIFLLTYDLLKFIFIMNIFIDLVVIGGVYGKVFRIFNFWLKCYWSRRKMLFKVRCKFLRSTQKFFYLFKEVWFLAKRNSSSTTLASLARLIASDFFWKYSFFNLSRNFFTS